MVCFNISFIFPQINAFDSLFCIVWWAIQEIKTVWCNEFGIPGTLTWFCKFTYAAVNPNARTAYCAYAFKASHHTKHINQILTIHQTKIFRQFFFKFLYRMSRRKAEYFPKCHIHTELRSFISRIRTTIMAGLITENGMAFTPYFA